MLDARTVKPLDKIFSSGYTRRMDPKVTVRHALKVAGGAAALAEMVGYSRGRVYQWQDEKRKHLPPLAAYRFERQTKQQQGE